MSTPGSGPAVAPVNTPNPSTTKLIDKDAFVIMFEDLGIFQRELWSVNPADDQKVVGTGTAHRLQKRA